MQQEILYKYLDSLSIDRDSLSVWYDFRSGNASGEILYNQVYTVPEHYFSGYLLASARPGLSVGLSERPVSGIDIGNFNYTDLIRVGNTIEDTNFTVFLDLEAQNHCGSSTSELSVLLTNRDAASDSEGFILGLTKSNRISFEYTEDNSRQNQILFDEVADGGVISLSKTNSFFELSYHNYPQRQHNSVSFSLPDYAANNTWFLGGLFTGMDGGIYESLSGTFKDFLYFNKGLNKRTKDELSAAFFITGVIPAYFTSEDVVSSSISDVLYNPSGNIATGVLSYELNEIPINQETGPDISLYEQSGVTGYVIGETIEFVTGDPTTSSQDVLVPEQLLYDYEKMLAYSKSNLVYLNGVDSNDILEIYAYQKPNSNFGNDLVFNAPYQVFQLDNPESGILYSNGIYQESGIDYTINNSFIISDSLVSGLSNTDQVRYDLISGQTSRFDYYNTGGGTFTVTGVPIPDLDCYLNGQKLISGYNYTSDLNTLSLLNTESLATGVLQFVPRSPDITYITTGNTDLHELSYIEEQAWLNGQRLVLNSDFIRTNRCTLRNTSDTRSFSNNIYDNNDAFWDL